MIDPGLLAGANKRGTKRNVALGLGLPWQTVRRASYQYSSEVRREVHTENPGEPCVYPALRREKMPKKGGAV